MNAFLWVAQALLAVAFLAHGLLFLFPPKAMRQRLEGQEGQPQLPAWFVRFIGAAEVLAAFGLLLPGPTGALPWLTALAAAGLVPIMAGAVVLHLSRKEVSVTIVTAVLLALAVLVAGGRWFVIPL